MGGCRLLYLVKSKNGKKFDVLLCSVLCQYIHSFIFPEMAVRGGGYSHAPKSATVYCKYD